MQLRAYIQADGLRGFDRTVARAAVTDDDLHGPRGSGRGVLERAAYAGGLVQRRHHHRDSRLHERGLRPVELNSTTPVIEY